MSTKIKSVAGYNFAGYSSIMVNLDPSVNYVVGRNRSGKSKLGLDLIWFILQGIAEKSSEGKIPLLGERFRFIGKDGATAMGELVLHDDVLKVDIRVIRTLKKHGTELSFSAPAGFRPADGQELNQQWLNTLFNIFLIAPKRFIELTSKEQAVALGIETSQWDEPIAALKLAFTDINRDVKKLELLEPVEMVETMPLEALQAQKQGIKERMAEQYRANQAANKRTRRGWENGKKIWDKWVICHNIDQRVKAEMVSACMAAIKTLAAHGFESQEASEWLAKKNDEIKHTINAGVFYAPEPTYIDELPDDTEMVGIDQKIMNATLNNEKAALYTAYTDKLEEKGRLELQRQENQQKQEDLYAARLAYIKSFPFPFDTLAVDDEGGLLLNDKPLKPQYFSSAELIRIVPTLMAAQNPEFKYVFIQDANLMDENTLAAVEKDLTDKGFQLVFELVGKEKVVDKNTILLKDFREVESYPITSSLIGSNKPFVGYENDNATKEITERAYESKAFPCRFCSAEFTDEYELEAHVVFNHNQFSDKKNEE